MDIFISYRREDAPATTGRIRDRLANFFGPQRVFLDVDTIPLGADFAEVISSRIQSSRAVLPIIGPNWATMKSGLFSTRIKKKNDFVRLEISEALSSQALVIPILVDGAQMPRLRQLPKDLSQLLGLNTLRVDHYSFDRDIDHLTDVLDGVMHGATGGLRQITSVEFSKVNKAILAERHSTKRCYFYPNIKRKISDKVKSNAEIDPREDIFAVFDLSAFGDAKYFIVVSEAGIHIKEPRYHVGKVTFQEFSAQGFSTLDPQGPTRNWIDILGFDIILNNDAIYDELVSYLSDLLKGLSANT